jgi:hypothetical protein
MSTLIPEAADGSRFTPDLIHRDGSFQIGQWPHEVRVFGYDQALASLRSMEVARWRRPSATSGKPGIVRAVRWVEVDR